jgi:molybdopterin/thiamine biosynthesis adenylyltransferase
MALVLVLMAALWGLGHWLGTPKQARWTMIALLFIAVLAVQIALPPGNALREATGGSAGEWLVLAGLAGLIWVYSLGLGRLRTRVRPENRAPEGPAKSLQETELERYARHIVLREIGGPGQKALKEARVLVIGAGGLGSPALLYLAAAGVGTIGVIDDDTVEGANLQRQVIHTDTRIGMPKVFSAEAAIKALNPFVTVRPYHRRLSDEIAETLFADYDLILDGCDNFETRYLVNRVAARAGIPVVSGALSQWEAQVSVFDPARDTPCYACIFPTRPAAHLAPSCAEAGVFGPLPGIAGALMAGEAVKEIAHAGEGLRGRMMIFDALYSEARTVGLKRRDGCPVCAEAKRT